MRPWLLRIGVGVGLLFAALVLVVAIAAPRVYLGPEGAFLQSDGARLHYTDEGSGEPVILLHGFAATGHLNWRFPGVLETLARDFRVVVLDARGHGRSDKPTDPAAYGLALVDDVVRLMDHLGIARAHVAGYSMGGFVTLRLLTRHPDRVLRAAPCGFGWQRPNPNALNVYDVLGSAFENGSGFGVLTAFLNPGRAHGPVRAAFTDLGAQAVLDERALGAVARSLPALTVTEADLRGVDVPVLSIVGSEDPLKAGVDALAQVLPHHELVVIPGGTHRTTPADARFGRALHRFLRGERVGVGAQRARRGSR